VNKKSFRLVGVCLSLDENFFYLTVPLPSSEKIVGGSVGGGCTVK